jgi:hypothetical protein
MATLWIREYAAIQHVAGHAEFPNATDRPMSPAPIPSEPGTDQTVSFTTTTQSSAFAADTVMIRITSSAAFHYVVGANPTATTGGLRVPADVFVDIGVSPGDKIAAVTAS